MSIHNHWRNKQLGNNLCWQESVCLDFLLRHKNVRWQWHGSFNKFYRYCADIVPVDNHGNGAIIINRFSQLSPKNLIQQLNTFAVPLLDVIYLAVNRYEILPINDLSLLYPDSIEESLDLIISQCKIPFKRLYCSLSVDGHHFVGIHGLDVYYYECN
jgi:hypothetical protein